MESFLFTYSSKLITSNPTTTCSITYIVSQCKYMYVWDFAQSLRILQCGSGSVRYLIHGLNLSNNPISFALIGKFFHSLILSALLGSDHKLTRACNFYIELN